MPTQTTIPKSKSDEWKERMRNYYRQLQQTGTMRVREMKAIDELFNKLDKPTSLSEKENTQKELWLMLNASWAKSTEFMWEPEGASTGTATPNRGNPRWQSHVTKLVNESLNVADLNGLEALWRKEMRAFLIASNRNLFPEQRHVREYSSRLNRPDTALNGEWRENWKNKFPNTVMKFYEDLGFRMVGTSNVSPNEWIARRSPNHSRIEELDRQIDDEIRTKVDDQLKKKLDGMDEMEKGELRIMTPTHRQEEIAAMRESIRAQLKLEELHNKLKDTETLRWLNRAIMEDHFSDAPPINVKEKRDRMDWLSDALLNFPNPFRTAWEWSADRITSAINWMKRPPGSSSP